MQDATGDEGGGVGRARGTQRRQEVAGSSPRRVRGVSSLKGPTDELEASKTLFYSPITPSPPNPATFQSTLRQVSGGSNPLHAASPAQQLSYAIPPLFVLSC